MNELDIVIKEYNELKEKYKVYRITLNYFFNKIKRTYSTTTTEEKVFEEIKNADLIIVDDLGNEYISENWGKEMLFNFFNFLYENKKSVIISTNLDDEQMKNFLEIQGSDKIFDRFKEMTKKYKFDWESKRKEINQKYFEELF